MKIGVRKLILQGEICHRGKKVSSYYSWPICTDVDSAEALIKSFKRAFCNTSVDIQYGYVSS
jgi:hypothetical protein